MDETATMWHDTHKIEGDYCYFNKRIFFLRMHEDNTNYYLVMG